MAIEHEESNAAVTAAENQLRTASTHGSNNPTQLRSLLKSISKLKLGNLLLLLLFLGIFLFGFRVYLELVLQSQVQSSTTQGSQDYVITVSILITDWLASALLSTAIVGFAYEWLVRGETQQSLEILLQQSLDSQNAKIVDSVIFEIPRALILNKDVQTRLLTGNNELLESAIRNFLGLRLGNEVMGAGLYEGILSKTLSYPERYLDFRNEIILTSITDASIPEVVRKRFYNVTLNIRYRTKLQAEEIRFARALDTDEYNARMRDLKYRYVLLFPQDRHFPVDQPIMELTSFKINGIELPPESSAEKGAQEWIIGKPALMQWIDKEVTIQYSITTKTYRYGHSFTASIVTPTLKSLFIFNFAKADIAHASAYDFFVSSKPPVVYRTPTHNPQMLVVELDEWAFPKGGVVFSWTLEEERQVIAGSEVGQVENVGSQTSGDKDLANAGGANG